MSGRILDTGLDLLDHQVLDASGRPMGKVDDVLLALGPAQGDPPRVAALLLGPQALGPRIGGRLGRWMAATAARLARSSEPVRVPLETVRTIGVCVELAVDNDVLEDAGRLEQWLRDHFISKIPGADRASE
jgi:sporulation protein YlmC with PRC-barrel domain